MARILGIDIGTDSLRGVMLRSALRSVEEERYVEIPLTEPPDSPGRIPELREAAANLLRALPAPPDSIIAAVPGEHVSLRRMNFPTAVRKRLSEVLPFELESNLPYDLEDAVIDHQMIDTSDKEISVLATAVLRTYVRSTIDMLSQIGLPPRELAVGAAALDGLANILPQLKSSEPVLVIDWSDDRTDLCFLENGRCIMARTLTVGLSQMPDASNDVERGITRTLAGFRAAGHEPPQLAYLCGSGAVAEGSADWLSSVLDLEVRSIALPVQKERRDGGPAFGKAAALAARVVGGADRINLRTGEFAPADAGHRLGEHLNLIVTCAVVVVMAIMFSLKATQARLVDEQAALQEQLASATKEVFGEPIRDVAEAELQVNNPQSDDPLPRFDAFDALAALSASVPEEMTHEVRRLTIDVADEKREGTMELQGSLASIAQRDQLVAALGEHPCFRDIDKGKTSPARGQDMIQYTIEAVVQCPGEGRDNTKGGSK